MRLLQHHESGSLFIPPKYSPSLSGIGEDITGNYGPSSVYDDIPSGSDTGYTGGAIGAASIGFQTALSTHSPILGGVAAGLSAAAIFAGPAAPFLMLAAGMIGPVAQLFKGCGSTCTQATEIANKAGVALEQMKSAYWAQPVRYRASQVAALYTIEQIAKYINTACGNPALGAAGQRCISERTVRGGSAPWCPTGTGCDMWTVYYDPIANDTGVVPDPQSTSPDVLTGTNQGISVAGFQLPMPLLIGGGALLALVLLTGEN